MSKPPIRRPSHDPWQKAEAAFKAVTNKTEAPPTAAPAPKAAPLPPMREMISLRVDREVLAFFQDEGPGWQDRINAALRKAAGL